MPKELEDLIARWKEKAETYREAFDYGWPAKLVETKFILNGKQYSLTSASFGLENNCWNHGLMEFFQADLAQDLKAIGAEDVYHLGFLD